ncbi:MAG: DUF3800 domain-containing protein [Lachnospiraceae bacterium]|nr:DUF3800 domain-containing protein [Lachnospiraceae bacterium]
MTELSIFVDESGDFGEYQPHSPYYIIAMVFHDQREDITADISALERKLANIGYANHCVHTGPVIRQEDEYRNESIETRQKITKHMMSFFRHVHVTFQTFQLEKRKVLDEVDATGRLSKDISQFVKEHFDYFLSFDVVKIYYDNGQVQVNKMLASVFNSLLDNVEFRKVVPSDYRLFQIADLACSLQLAKLKMETKNLSNSENAIFESERILKKNYIKPFEEKRFA